MVKIKFLISIQITSNDLINFSFDISYINYKVSWENTTCIFCISSDTDASYLLLKYNFLSIV